MATGPYRRPGSGPRSPRQVRAAVVIATGTSQREAVAALAATPGIARERVELFHLDEYYGVPADHPANFRRYLRERFVERLPARPAAFH